MNFTGNIEDLIVKIKNKLSISQMYALIWAMVFGILAHGYAFFNRLSYHDNSASLFSLGATFESGRWFLGIIYRLQLMTTKSFSEPWFNGIFSVIIIAISAVIVVKILGVKRKFTGVCIGVLMEVFPGVTSIFSFMFTSWPYFLGLLFAVLCVYCVTQKKKIGFYILGILFLSCSLGIYQAFFAVAIVLFLLILLLEVFRSQINSVIDYVKRGVSFIGVLAVALVLWAIVRRVFLSVLHIEAVAYKGMNDGYQLALLPHRLFILIKSFFTFRMEGINALLYLRIFSQLIFVIAVIQLLLILAKRCKKLSVLFVSFVGIILLPIGMEIVYLLSTSDLYKVDSLMLYGAVFIYIIPLVLIEEMETITLENKIVRSGISLVTWIQLMAIAVMVMGYVYLDNAAYLKADLAVEQSRAYFTELVANIKSCEDFSDDMDIVFVGWDSLDDGTFLGDDGLDALDAIQFDKFPEYKDIVTYSGSINFMREHIAFGNEHVIIDHGDVATEKAVAEMPCYPCAGSICVIDNRVIVKMGKE